MNISISELGERVNKVYPEQRLAIAGVNLFRGNFALQLKIGYYYIKKRPCSLCLQGKNKVFAKNKKK